MNEDDLYVEISDDDYYYKLKDKSGYYKVMGGYRIYYLKNAQHHRLNGPAWISLDDDLKMFDGEQWTTVCYFLYAKLYTKKEFDQHPDVIQYRLRKFQEYLNE